MSDLRKNYDVEIDLLDLIKTVWDGKWKIALFIIAGIFIAFGLYKTSFIATTEIRPITTFEEDKYRLFNQSPYQINNNNSNSNNNNINNSNSNTKNDNKYKDIVIEYLVNNKDRDIAGFLKESEKDIVTIFEITNSSLLNQYIEEILEGNLLEVGIKKFKLIDKEKFDDEKAYIDKVKKFASEILILKPQNFDGKEQGKILHYTIKGTYNDIKKWKKLLVFIDFEVNKQVRNIIKNRFETITSVQKKKRDYKIEDFNTQIENVKQDYEETMKNRLAFLAEQASIARKLDIKKNTIQLQTFINTTDISKTNLKIEGNPFYLRGYIAIEEEMRLINTRNNKTSFMKKVLELEKGKRVLEQDKRLQRANALFANTPIKQGAFKAASVNVSATKYVYKDKSLHYIMAIILSGMIGVFYVLIGNSFAKRKKKIVTS